MTRYRRSFTILVSAALTAGLLTTAFAAPASAAKPRCAGLKATIVGTAKGEVIVGTKKRDVIVARGGHDKIYGRGGNDVICGGAGHDRIVGAGGKDIIFGGPGRDKLFGGTGRDRLLGGPANDRLAGGPGNDACLQGAGTGPWLGCERPRPPAPPPPATLAIAYSDLNANHKFDTGDVLISKLVDTNLDGKPSQSDTIVMGRYPTKLVPTAADFADWTVKTHIVASVDLDESNRVQVTRTSGGGQYWGRIGGGNNDAYIESTSSGESAFIDKSDTDANDAIYVDIDSPSQPDTAIPFTEDKGFGDDEFIDVEILY